MCECVCEREIWGNWGWTPSGESYRLYVLKDTVLVLHSDPRWTRSVKSPRLRTGPRGLYSEGGDGSKGLLYEEEERICLCLHHSDPGTGSSFVAQGIPWTLLTESPMPTPLPPRQPVPDVHLGATGADGEADGRDCSSWAGPLPGS